MIGHEIKSKRTVLDVSYGPKDGPNFGLGIHRASLFEALLDVATANSIEITKQHRVAATHTNDQGRFVSFENGETLGPFDLVVDTTARWCPNCCLMVQFGAL